MNYYAIGERIITRVNTYKVQYQKGGVIAPNGAR